MDKRAYNKIFVHKNRKEGSEKIILGYEYNAKDLILSKDKETTFHVPYFTPITRLSAASLIQDGATAGPFPAASDRIFKNKKDYGNSTPNGNPIETADGVWFCSWLYKSPNGPIWMDRYYNPGKITSVNSLLQLGVSQYIYIKNDPVFSDRPSTMFLDPGVMYKYFHIGENTFGDIVSAFGGLSGDKLKLDLSNWKQDEDVDKSQNKLKVNISSSGGVASVVGITEDPSLKQKTTLKFNTKEDTEAFVFYDKSYCLPDEFTWSFWAQSSDWNACQYTQLVGNYSSQGGIGVFIDTLSSFPFFVIPETNYGHILFINDDGTPFLDKSTRSAPGVSSQPNFVVVNKDNHVIVCENNFLGVLYKIDSTGKTISNKSGFLNSNGTEKIIQLLCGPDDSVFVLTNLARYFFDKHLNLTTKLLNGSEENTQAAYKYNINKDSYTLNIKNQTIDLKYIEEQEWSISATDSNLYRDSVLFAVFDDKAKSFAIDPFDRIWVMHGLGNISVYSSQQENLTSPLFKFGFQNERIQEKQSIHFFCHYDRATETREWRAIIHYSENPQYFIVAMDGDLIKKTEKYSAFNISTSSFLEEDSLSYKYQWSGDITGYEHRRVFQKLSPYKNKPQFVVKTSFQDAQTTDVNFYHNNFYTPLEIKPNGFHHFSLSLGANQIKLFINSVKKISAKYSGRFNLSYELQPSFYIGVPQGSKQNYNKEIKKTSLIFNGEIADIKIFNYTIPEEYMEIFLREALLAQDIYWSLPSQTNQYIEKIERVFKNKLPGFKTNFFNIKIAGSGIRDVATRLFIEDYIKTMLKDISPANAELVKIQWLD